MGSGDAASPWTAVLSGNGVDGALKLRLADAQLSAVNCPSDNFSMRAARSIDGDRSPVSHRFQVRAGFLPRSPINSAAADTERPRDWRHASGDIRALSHIG